MNLSEYAVKAAKTRNQETHQWEHYMLGMADEVGEIAKIFKKCLNQSLDCDIDYEIGLGADKDGVPWKTRLIEELGDLQWFTSQMCLLYGIDPDEVLSANIRKLQGARYRDGFTLEEEGDRDLDREAQALTSD